MYEEETVRCGRHFPNAISHVILFSRTVLRPQQLERTGLESTRAYIISAEDCLRKRHAAVAVAAAAVAQASLKETCLAERGVWRASSFRGPLIACGYWSARRACIRAVYVLMMRRSQALPPPTFSVRMRV